MEKTIDRAPARVDALTPWPNPQRRDAPAAERAKGDDARPSPSRGRRRSEVIRLLEAALDQRQRDHRDDLAWIQAQGLNGRLADEVCLRLDQRSGVWLRFVERVIGFEGDYADFETAD